MSGTPKYTNSKRVMLGDESDPACLIFTNLEIDAFDEKEKSYPIADCEIKLYHGNRPIILHNDTSQEDNAKSVKEYLDKLTMIKTMVNNVYQHSIDNPTENYLERAFLNPPTDNTRVFGGTLIVHYLASFKIFTVDICDCNNKSRKSYNPGSMKNYTEKLTQFLTSAIEDVKVLEQKLRG